MNILAYILAADEEFDWVHIVGLLLFIGIGLISSVFQKWKESQKTDKTAKPKTPPARPGARKQTPQSRRAQRAQRAQPTQPPPVRQQESAEKTVRVAQEMQLRQQRQAQLEAERSQRMATRQSPEADTQAIEARLVSVPGGARPMETEQIGKPGIPELTTRSAAQQAMILHEIFSPPKALRQGDEMWDT